MDTTKITRAHHLVDGPCFLDAVADMEAMAGNVESAAIFRQEAANWAADKRLLKKFLSQLSGMQDSLRDIKARLEVV